MDREQRNGPARPPFWAAILALLLPLAVCPPNRLLADEGLNLKGFDSSRYESLWIKSPFAVESAAEAPESTNYSLLGVCRVDGADYASIVNKQSRSRYLIGKGKSQNGLSLVSLQAATKDGLPSVTIRANGELMSLKMEQPQANPVAAAAINYPAGTPLPYGSGRAIRWVRPPLPPGAGQTFDSSSASPYANAITPPPVRHHVSRIVIPGP